MSLLDLLLPPGCLACGAWVPGPPRFLCAPCATRVRPPEPPLCARCGAPASEAPESCPECADWPSVLASARSAALLQPPADDLVHALKYGGWPEAAREMARRMVPLLPPGGGRLLPIPTTRDRLRRRGYNQAERLARALARLAPGWEVAEPLERVRGGGSQVALHREERMANVSGAFTLRPDASFPDASGSEVLSGPADPSGSLEVRAPVQGSGARGGAWVLIDDVLTTGATASAAARALEAAGLSSVHLITYGRALPGEGGRNAPRPLPPGFLRTWLRTGRSPRPPA